MALFFATKAYSTALLQLMVIGSRVSQMVRVRMKKGVKLRRNLLEARDEKTRF